MSRERVLRRDAGGRHRRRPWARVVRDGPGRPDLVVARGAEGRSVHPTIAAHQRSDFRLRSDLVYPTHSHGRMHVARTKETPMGKDQTKYSSEAGRVSRARAREHLRRFDTKRSRLFEIMRAHFRDNIDLMDDVTAKCFSDEEDHTLGGCAKTVLVAQVAWWGSACDLLHSVVNTCMSDDAPPVTPPPKPQAA